MNCSKGVSYVIVRPCSTPSPDRSQAGHLLLLSGVSFVLVQGVRPSVQLLHHPTALMSATSSWLTALQHLQQLQRLAAQHEQHLAQQVQHHDMAQLDMAHGAMACMAAAECLDNTFIDARCPTDDECELIVMKLKVCWGLAGQDRSICWCW